MSKSGEQDEGNLDDAVIVALGSNLGDGRDSPAVVLERALDRLPEVGFTVARRSSFWSSAAWPDPADPHYINAVALVETSLIAPDALAALHVLEHDFGRVRSRPNAPRVLDLDLIAHGRVVVASGGLVLPHPRAAERRFVMGPLAEIAPSWRHPISGRRAIDLAAAAQVGQDAEPIPH